MLSGTLAVGTSTITVTYEGKTTTFDVTVLLTVDVLSSYLAGKPANTKAIPHNIVININNTSEFYALKTVLNDAPDKYVYLDLSGSTITTIPNYVFWSGDFDGTTGDPIDTCVTLTGVTIPDSVTSIGASAFRYCANITSVIIPNNVLSIGESAFEGCASLADVTIGNKVTTIEDYAFYYCSSLTSITIPASVTSIGEEAFRPCRNLVRVTFMSGSISTIANDAFPGEDSPKPGSLGGEYFKAGGGAGTYNKITANQWAKQ
jgi:hypothetical protein